MGAKESNTMEIPFAELIMEILLLFLSPGNARDRDNRRLELLVGRTVFGSCEEQKKREGTSYGQGELLFLLILMIQETHIGPITGNELLGPRQGRNRFSCLMGH